MLYSAYIDEAVVFLSKNHILKILKSQASSNPFTLITIIVVFNLLYYPIKSLLLGMKWVFKHQDL